MSLFDSCVHIETWRLKQSSKTNKNYNTEKFKLDVVLVLLFVYILYPLTEQKISSIIIHTSVINQPSDPIIFFLQRLFENNEGSGMCCLEEMWQQLLSSTFFVRTIKYFFLLLCRDYIFFEQFGYNMSFRIQTWRNFGINFLCSSFQLLIIWIRHPRQLCLFWKRKNIVELQLSWRPCSVKLLFINFQRNS